MMRWHIPIMGFTQRITRPTGFDKVWQGLRESVDPGAVVLTPQCWRMNWKAIAAFLERNSPEPEKAWINIYAYSWGCGHGFKDLTRQLQKRGMVVRNAVLCDPVYHSWWRPWRALAMSPAIRIPRNVREVHWLRQYNNRPAGTDLIAEDRHTIIHDAVVIEDREHEYMDDSPEFFEMCMAVATGKKV